MRRGPCRWDGVQPVSAVRMGALALALAGCAVGGGLGPTSGSGAPPSTPSRPAAADGPIVVGLSSAPPRTLNPLLDGPDTATLDTIEAGTLARGYSVDPATGALVPEMLLVVPTVANGGVVVLGDGTLEVTYRVAPGAQWSDGETVTAEDLRFTLDLLTAPDLPIRHDLRAIHAAVVAGSAVAEGLTLTLRMRARGDPGLLFGIIVPAHQVAGTDLVRAWNDRMWAAGGPFEMAAWQPGRYLLLRRNPHYGPEALESSGRARVEEVAFLFFPDGGGTTLEQAFAAHLVDVAVLWRGSDPGAYAGSAARGAMVDTAPGPSWQALLFHFGPANPNPVSLNREKRFRVRSASGRR